MTTTEGDVISFARTGLADQGTIPNSIETTVTNDTTTRTGFHRDCITAPPSQATFTGYRVSILNPQTVNIA